MIKFNLRCPSRFLKRCELSTLEKEKIMGPEKYKAFLMYQSEDQDEFIKDVIKEYFKNPVFFVYDYDDVRGLGVKFCKICKLGQACDFGIAVLSPENENVFMEVGLLIGMEKPCLYIVNESKLKTKDIRKLPFDISDQIVIKYDSREKLLSELEKEVPDFMPKVQVDFGYEKALRENVKSRLDKLKPEEREILKKFVSFGKVDFSIFEYKSILINTEARVALQNLKFVRWDFRLINNSKTPEEVFSIEEAYRPILEDLLFSD